MLDHWLLPMIRDGRKVAVEYRLTECLKESPISGFQWKAINSIGAKGQGGRGADGAWAVRLSRATLHARPRRKIANGAAGSFLHATAEPGLSVWPKQLYIVKFIHPITKVAMK